MQDFQIRPYGRRELALLYFPGEGSLAGKVAQLKRWLQRDPGFYQLLKENGYKPRGHTLSARQVRLITAFLGEP